MAANNEKHSLIIKDLHSITNITTKGITMCKVLPKYKVLPMYKVLNSLFNEA
jgi:hypothetical protein